MDYGHQGVTTPLGLLNQHYAVEEQRKENFKKYAEDLKSDIHRIKKAHDDKMKQDTKTNSEMRNFYEQEWMKLQKLDGELRKESVKKYEQLFLYIIHYKKYTLLVI